MKNSRLGAAFAFGGAATALIACSSTEPETSSAPPNTTTVSTVTSTVAGPVTNTPVTSGTTLTATTAPGTTSTTGGTTTTGAAVTTTTGAAVTTTGVGGATATGATSVTATTSGSSCEGATATAPVAITPTDGWVNCDTNTIGVQGAFYTYDDGTSSIEPADFSASGAEICATGTVAAEATGVWGVGVGFNFSQELDSDTANPWNATAMGITGIKFTLSALPTGGLLRLIYASGGLDHCVQITAAGEQTVLFSATTEDCWTAGGDPPDATTLTSVKWQVAAVTDEYAFDFCISDVSAVP